MCFMTFNELMCKSNTKCIAFFRYKGGRHFSLYNQPNKQKAALCAERINTFLLSY